MSAYYSADAAVNEETKSFLHLQGHIGISLGALLGFSLYSRMVHIVQDARLVRTAFVRLLSLGTVTRFAYFCASLLIVGYLLLALVYASEPERFNCHAATLAMVILLFLVHVSNHWVFLSRLMAVWYGHQWSNVVRAYVFFGFSVICAMAALNYRYTTTYSTPQARLCVLFFDTLDHRGKQFRMASCICDFVIHTINIFLTVLRLSTLREEGGTIDDRTITPRSLTDAVRRLVRNHHKSRFTLAQDLMQQGVQFWLARTALQVGLVVVPTFRLRGDQVAYMICFSVFMTLDVELAGALYRATVDAAYSMRTTPLEAVPADTAASSELALPNSCQRVPMRTFTRRSSSQKGLPISAALS